MIYFFSKQNVIKYDPKPGLQFKMANLSKSMDIVDEHEEEHFYEYQVNYENSIDYEDEEIMLDDIDWNIFDDETTNILLNSNVEPEKEKVTPTTKTATAEKSFYVCSQCNKKYVCKGN